MKKELPNHSIYPGRPTPAWSTLLFSCLLAGVSLLMMPATVFADEQSDEQEMKAALLFKLTRFIHWPDEASGKKIARLTICSSSSDPISPYLDYLRNEISYGRTIDVLHSSNIEVIKKECRLLYISKSQLNANIDGLKNSPVLTISDKLGFARRGGMIEITRRNERLRFHINHAVALQADIRISAPLLKISTIIKNDESGEAQ